MRLGAEYAALLTKPVEISDFYGPGLSARAFRHFRIKGGNGVIYEFKRNYFGCRSGDPHEIGAAQGAA